MNNDRIAATPPVVDQYLTLMHHVHLMKSYCAEQGRPVPPAVAAAIVEAEKERPEAERIKQHSAPTTSSDSDFSPALIVAWTAHAKLCELVSPATPESIKWTTSGANTTAGKQRWSFVLAMLTVTITALIGVVIILSQTRAQPPILVASQDVSAALDRLVLNEHFVSLHDKAIKLNDNRDALQTLVSTTLGKVKGVSILFTQGSSAANLAAGNISDLEALKTNTDWDVSKDAIKNTARSLVRGNQEWRSIIAAGAAPDYLLLVLAGVLGAAFYNLYWAHQYIVHRTFDPVYVQRYFIRLVLGAVSGLILGHFGGDVVAMYSQSSNTSTLVFSRVFLALLGGYTVEAVNLMLTRVADALSTLFRGSFDDVVRAKEQEIMAKAQKANVELRTTLLSKLTDLRRKDTIDIGDLDKVIDSLKS